MRIFFGLVLSVLCIANLVCVAYGLTAHWDPSRIGFNAFAALVSAYGFWFVTNVYE